MSFEKNEIVLKGNGKASRDFIWMGTVCNVMEQLCKLETAPNDIFNLSGEQSFSMLEIANYVKKATSEALNKDIEVTVNLDDQTPTPAPLQVSSQKLKQLIPFANENKFVDEAKAIFNLLSASN